MLSLFICFLISDCFAESQIDGIDCIYLINLDRRPDRLAFSTAELARYNIQAQRFSAIDGKKLPYETLLEIGLPYKLEMLSHRWANTPAGNGKLQRVYLDRSAENKIVFFEGTTIGAVGCALSHLSVLKEAYAAGYETIWILEDDICIKQDPHILADLIKSLDSLTDGQWDVLYTDMDEFGEKSQPVNSFWWLWRPDLALFNSKIFTERNRISKDFIQIGSRGRMHSFIIRRSGMKKLLDYIENYHLYQPIDHEIAFASNMRLFMTAYPIVTYSNKFTTDIQIFP